MSTAYHPQTDGLSERTIQTLEDMLGVYVNDFRGALVVYIVWFLLVIPIKPTVLAPARVELQLVADLLEDYVDTS
ncbi:putative reverse transcriptase domain-containing protein [Tanacetum coccineum]